VIVMPANSTGIVTGYLAGKYTGTLGHLFSPGAQRGPYPFMPYALDNGAYSAFTAKTAWDPVAWLELLIWAKNSGQAPRWVLVPDVVGDRAATLRKWDAHSLAASQFGWPLAFAAQDGMSPSDVPSDASVVFVGGSTEWKLDTLHMWCRSFPRVHIGRINTYRWLTVCERAGAESVDGTGWFRGDKEQLRGLEQWCAESTGQRPRVDQQSLFSDPTGDETGHGLKSCEITARAPVGAGK